MEVYCTNGKPLTQGDKEELARFQKFRKSRKKLYKCTGCNKSSNERICAECNAEIFNMSIKYKEPEDAEFGKGYEDKLQEVVDKYVNKSKKSSSNSK